MPCPEVGDALDDLEALFGDEAPVEEAPDEEDVSVEAEAEEGNVEAAIEAEIESAAEEVAEEAAESDD